MIDLSNRCIISGSTENLNTTMEVTLDNEKYKISISDEHEDEASPSLIRKLIPKRLEDDQRRKEERLAKLDEFKQLAADLGFDLVKKGSSGLIIAQEPQRPAPEVRRAAPADPEALIDKPTVNMGGAQFKMQKNTRQTQKVEGLSIEEAEAALEAAKRRSADTETIQHATSGEASSFPRHQLPDKVAIRTRSGEVVEVDRPKRGAQTMQTVKGREGIPTAIPRTIRGSDGETTITIVDTGGDKTLKARAQQLGRMRETGDRADYSRPCPPCQGTGYHAKKLCKKCDGVGFLI